MIKHSVITYAELIWGGKKVLIKEFKQLPTVKLLEEDDTILGFVVYPNYLEDKTN